MKQDKLLPQTEAGLLFVESCVRQAKAGTGRIGIIVPNGYLGNRSPRYQVFRDWMLRHCRVAAICSFPRFTFKTSGADVSASVIYLQKRDVPLRTVLDDPDYHFSVQMIENVGWNLGDKKAAPRYLRNAEDGSYVIDPETGDRLLDSDFSASLRDLRSSLAAADFPWLVSDLDLDLDLDEGGGGEGGEGWAVSIQDVLSDRDLTLDPKRYSKKYHEVCRGVKSTDHARLGDLVDFVEEGSASSGTKTRIDPAKRYNYVEIQNIRQGEYRSEPTMGWDLPSRARHFAEPLDIYVGSIWSSVQKWCLISYESEDEIVTNGCHRLKMKLGLEDHLIDIVGFLCSEAYTVQMRALARGSDGLQRSQLTMPRMFLFRFCLRQNVKKLSRMQLPLLVASRT